MMESTAQMQVLDVSAISTRSAKSKKLTLDRSKLKNMLD
jgi:hypothetical protein